MGDSYWNHQGVLKRPRSHYYDGRNGSQSTQDTSILQSAYDCYLQNAVPSKTVSLTPGETVAYATRPPGQFMKNSPGIGHGSAVGRDRLPIDDQGARFGAVGRDHQQALMSHSWAIGQGHLAIADHAAMAPSGAVGQDRLHTADPPMACSGPFRLDLVSKSRNISYDSWPAVEKIPSPSRRIAPLPRDASSTLFVEGLPSDCRKREAAHISPFRGIQRRLVPRDSKHRKREPLILCFVDFASPACAATAMSALQGYKMDEHDSDSGYLRLEFSQDPGPRSHRKR